jgi:hypothetical protein
MHDTLVCILTHTCTHVHTRTPANVHINIDAIDDSSLTAAAQPSPQLTMPSWVATPSVMVMSGPPLSPWHASVPPAQ